VGAHVVCLVLYGSSSHLLNQAVFNLEKSYEVTLEQEQECASKQENIMFLTHFSSRFGMHATLHMTDDINGEWLWTKEER